MKKQILILIYFFLVISNVFAQKTEYVNSFDNVKIAYNVIGQGDQTLVFVHGWSCDKSYWNKQIPILKDQYKIITIDLAGHGESGTNRSEYTMGNYAHDILTVIKHLDLDNVIFVGHSMGAGIVLEVGSSCLNKTKAIISIDGFGNIPKIKNENELETFEKKLRSFWKLEDFETKTYSWIKSWPSPKSDSLMIDSIAKDMSLNDPYASVESIVNYFLWNDSEYPNLIKTIGGLPIISISSVMKPDENLYQEIGVNFLDIRINNVSHFLQICNSKEFNIILLEQLKKLR